MTTKNLRCSLCGKYRKNIYKKIPKSILRFLDKVVNKHKLCVSCVVFSEDMEEHNSNITELIIQKEKIGFYRKYYFNEENINNIYSLPSLKEMLNNIGETKMMDKGMEEMENISSKNKEKKNVKSYIG